MESKKLFLGVAAIALGLTSCKGEKETQAEKTVDNYVVYVDSLENVSSEEAMANWQTIEANYELRSSQAETALADLKDDAKAKEKLEASRMKYEAMKTKMQDAMPTKSQTMRNSLFGEGKVGDDMSFAWVNAANIHDVYQQFVHTVEDNKDSYSREDWDEIKMMYEALDSRKNTVEKEGLSSEDNRKIAGLKLKFAPMYTVNRMGAKSEEMDAAKK
ncbi:DUF6565 domain-containing protein [Flavobacterium frigidarium]|jgi:hypothetical protein|uniref:DUF6565 domain-containing protein n=1 Tax=Flavobacterium frigidarium TaxID=99286 RepID=UPI001DE64AE8|nr:hypothetical protein [Bacteroidota bacterium]|tara:strand:+ start:1756 stop:2403 length:648 start_codon:yes stop_codon:yes gene_type:complete